MTSSQHQLSLIPSPNAKDSESSELDNEGQSTSILVLYATETGTALDIAEQLAREARRRLYDVRLASVDAYPIEELVQESLVLFVVSTTGSGIPPRSMTNLWSNLLRADLPNDILDELHFAVFGLGDSAYERFCWSAKMLRRRLVALGAVEIADMALGDEQAPLGIEDSFDEWLPRLFETLSVYLPQPASAIDNVDSIPAPRIQFLDTSILPQNGSQLTTREDDSSISQISGLRQKVTVKKNQRMTAEDWFQDVRHIEFTVDKAVEYEPGDVAVVYPEASPADVKDFLCASGWENSADESLLFKTTDPLWVCPKSIPRQVTLRKLFTSHLDINAVPRRSFFRFIRHFSSDEKEKEKLEEFCTKEGAEDLFDYTSRVRRTIREVLAEFRSVKIPKEYIFDVFPLLNPRQFSIASSAKAHPGEIHLCVAIVRYKTKLKAPRKGTCSTYLAKLPIGFTLQIGLQKGFLSVPDEPTTPIVCIGPGTGIAPIRALLEHRVIQNTTDNTLYFGCRSESKDHHYASEWRALSESQKLTYRAAFSRDGPEGLKRTYVQDLMIEDVNVLWDVIGKRKGWIYISGSSNKMPAAVKGTIKEAARVSGGLTEEEAKAFLKGLQENGRLFEECWS